MARRTAREQAERAAESENYNAALVYAVLDVADAIRENRQPTYSQEYPPDPPEPAKAVLTNNGLRW